MTFGFRRLQHTLMLAFLSLSIIPLLIATLLFFRTYTQDLTEQTTQHLVSLRDTQSQRLTEFFDDLEQEAQSFAKSELANATGGRFYGLVDAFHQFTLPTLTENDERLSYFNQIVLNKNASGREAGHERYRLLHKRYHWAFDEYLKRSSFSNIVLTNLKGMAVYSPDPARFFGVNIQTHPQLNDVYQQLVKNTKNNVSSVIFSDFHPNTSLAWFGVPIVKNDKTASYAFFSLERAQLMALFDDFTADRTIQMQWVGEDGQARFSHQPVPWLSADPRLSAAQKTPANIDVFTLNNATEMLSAYQQISVFGKPWYGFVEIPTHKAFAHIDRLKAAFFWGTFSAIVLVIFVAHCLSNFITAPLLRLTDATEQVANGNINESIETTDRQDEIGRLATSFASMQRSLREKLALIQKQHQAQEQHLATIQQKNAALKQADKLKDEFLANTTHELRTPLHGMIAIAESLHSNAHGEITPNQAHQTERLISHGQRLARLVDDLLDYHQLRHGNFEVSQQVVDMASIASVVVELSGHALAQKPIRLINHIERDLPWILADEQRLEQVMYHLLGHAIHTTDEGKIVLSAHTLHDQLRVQIIDTGRGIPDDQLEHLFEPLLHHTPSPHSVGLSISRHLIAMMGGQLFVSSQELVGTTFSFTLPLAPEEALLSHSTQHFAPLTETHLSLPDNGSGQKILIVDDEAVNRQILNNLLRVAGYHVITAENGRQALELLLTENPELMLLDIMMPDMTGYDVCQKVRKQSDLPIILLSARHQVEDRIKGFEFGANDYVSKPFNRAELLARIEAHLSSRNNEKVAMALAESQALKESLLSTQGRLLPLLTTASEPILCVQEDGYIRYANQAACQRFGYDAMQMCRFRLSDFLLSEWIVSEQGEQPLVYCLQQQTQTINTQILPLPHPNGLSHLLVLETPEDAQHTRIALMEHAISVLSAQATHNDQETISALQALGGEFVPIAQRLTSPEVPKPEQIRQLLVDTMKTALDCWEMQTDKNKFDLAEESGLWRVYLDRSTLQTRTLDKYLHLETLPKTPRWRTVMSTLDFVLQRCLTSDAIRQKLETQQEKLRQGLNQLHRQNTF